MSWFSSEKNQKMTRASDLNKKIKLKKKCIGSHKKKLKNDEGKRKYHIIGKMHVFSQKLVFDEERDFFLGGG